MISGDVIIFSSGLLRNLWPSDDIFTNSYQWYPPGISWAVLPFWSTGIESETVKLRNLRMSKKKICITGGWYSSQNTGDQAILITITDLLKKRIPDAQFTVFSSKPEFIKQKYGFQSFSHRRQLLKELWSLMTADLLVMGGGTPFYDDLLHMLHYSFLIFIAKVFNTRTMIYATSSRKLKTKYGRILTRYIFNNVDQITIREKETITEIKKLGIKKPFHLTVDPALTLPLAPPKVMDEILHKESLNDLKRPLIGICLRPMLTDAFHIHHYQLFSKEEIEHFKRTLVRISDYLTTIGTVVFVPMHTVAPDDDREFAHEIIGRMQNSSEVKSIENSYSPQENKGILSKLDLVLGVRLHALILASSANVPVIAISYGHKTSGLMELLGLKNFSFNIGQLNYDDFKKQIDFFWSNKDRIREELKRQMISLKKEAEKNAEKAAALCDL